MTTNKQGLKETMKVLKHQPFLLRCGLRPLPFYVKNISNRYYYLLGFMIVTGTLIYVLNASKQLKKLKARNVYVVVKEYDKRSA
jgi:hypothetical protein